MPGIIEDGQPPRPSVHVATVEVRTTGDDDFVVPDIELFVDRLRFMGMDREFVEEAEQRLRADRRSGSQWVAERLHELTPARKAPTCDCGEQLVDTVWRGRATVRCSECGARWGIEVLDERSESLWSISGPSARWRAAHPIVQDGDDDLQPDDVMRYGLPPLPGDGIEPGAYFPVAIWQGVRHAAVLYVHRLEPHEFEWPGDEYESETEHLVLGDAGEWTSTGSGGGGWVNVFDPPTDLLEKYVVLGTGTSGFGTQGETVQTTGGLCSEAVAAVEATDKDGVRLVPVTPERPFFVVGVVGPGHFRILDKHGNVLRGARGHSLRLDFKE